ncbi:MAG: DUF4835 family protein [Flavobacteriales bacterium]|nr:DUF4835 family protein [Flavobacteriales bacterium]HRO39798.1 DUF4835 family protein [Flavobacteriales bacterium]HRP80582.1 DUF4835 family protein [Flavobacteriales bacterium]
MRSSFLLILTLLAAARADAQEFNCKVSVIAPQIQSTPKRVFQSMETSITQLMNTRRWTNLNFSPQERIDCNMLLTVNEQSSADRFKATLQVIYSRPVYGTDYNSPVVDILDNNVQFSFLENTQIDFSPERFSGNLSSVIAFYAYYILGVDADTFSPMGGTDFYTQAQNVVNNAQNASEPGWKAFEDQKNRYWLLDNQQQAVFRPLREFLYTYHRQGFDEMAEDLAKGRKACADAVNTLKAVHQAKPSSYNLQVLFNAKYNELVELYKGADPQEKAKVYNTLQIIDPGHISQYMEMMKAR